MRWTFKKNNENKNTVEIGYSHADNISCDGVIMYDKETEELTVKKHSKGCSEYESNRAFQFIYGLIGDSLLSFEKQTICTG